jgi:hypothetical protein
VPDSCAGGSAAASGAGSGALSATEKTSRLGVTGDSPVAGAGAGGAGSAAAGADWLGLKAIARPPPSSSEPRRWAIGSASWPSFGPKAAACPTMPAFFQARSRSAALRTRHFPFPPRAAPTSWTKKPREVVPTMTM